MSPDHALNGKARASMRHRAEPHNRWGWRTWLRRRWPRGGTRTESEHEKSRHSMLGQRARHALAALIAGVWTVQFFAVWLTDFESDGTVNTAFLLVAGSVFSAEAISRFRSGGGDQS